MVDILQNEDIGIIGKSTPFAKPFWPCIETAARCSCYMPEIASKYTADTSKKSSPIFSA